MEEIRVIRGCAVDENEGLWWAMRRNYMFGGFLCELLCEKDSSFKFNIATHPCQGI